MAGRYPRDLFGNGRGDQAVLGIASILAEQEGALIGITVSQERFGDPLVTFETIMSPEAYMRLSELLEELRIEAANDAASDAAK